MGVGRIVRTISHQLEPVASARQQLTVTNAVATLTVPATAVSATCRLESNDIRFTLDGSAPDGSTGMILKADETLELESRAELTAFRAFRDGAADGTLHVEYFQVDV